MDRPKLIYLASPYSDPDPIIMEARRVAACRTAAFLIAQGVAVISPIAHNTAIIREAGGQTGWDIWKAQDIAMLSACHELAVLMLPGWKQSVGVQDEIRIATERGIVVTYFQPLP